MPTRPLFLGRSRAPDGASAPAPLELPAHHFVTHAAVVGMTGSGKTGLVMVLVEEALRSKVPVLMIDIKGDLPNLLLAFPELAAAQYAPWVDAIAAERQGKSALEVGEDLAKQSREGLAGWGLGEADVAAFRAGIAPRLITPGTTAGEPLHVLSALEASSPLWQEDEESARDALSASISLLLRLVDRDADPAKSRDHVMLSHLAERRLAAGQPAGLAQLLADLLDPPIAQVGAMAVDDFLSPKERKELAQQLNALVASPTFAAWQKGASLDVGAWLRPSGGKTPAVIVSVAHLDDQERALVLGLLFDQILAWVRSLPGTSDLRALVVFDEVFGFLPPHPANPPTKRPILALLKQARAFGVGIVLATQNPMDIDYKALSNAGVWFVGRLQTDADRERVVEGLASSTGGAGGASSVALAAAIKALPPRTFYVRDVHHTPPSLLLSTRWALSWLRGPMTRRELMSLARSLSPASATAAGMTASAGATATTGAPRTPEGFRVFYAHSPTHGKAWQYTPWIAATAVAHARDAKLGAAITRSLLIAAPLGPDGRPDMARAASIDPSALAASPTDGAAFRPIPDALFKKAGQDAAARAVREHVYRTLEVPIEAHEGLGLTRADGEPREAFAERCRVEAMKRAAAAEHAVLQKSAPKVAKLHDKMQSVEAKLAGAGAELNSLPGTMTTAIIGLAVGRGTVRQAESQRGKILTRIEKLRAEKHETETGLRALIAERDAEIAGLRHAATRTASEITSRAWRPKKNDVEITQLAIAWGVE
jgi:hypothetical protein